MELYNQIMDTIYYLHEDCVYPNNGGNILLSPKCFKELNDELNIHALKNVDHSKMDSIFTPFGKFNLVEQDNNDFNFSIVLFL